MLSLWGIPSCNLKWMSLCRRSGRVAQSLRALNGRLYAALLLKAAMPTASQPQLMQCPCQLCCAFCFCAKVYTTTRIYFLGQMPQAKASTSTCNCWQQCRNRLTFSCYAELLEVCFQCSFGCFLVEGQPFTTRHSCALQANGVDIASQLYWVSLILEAWL